MLGRAFFERDSRQVAPDLLNKVLMRGERMARIVEVEAYAGAEDPGAHSFRGKTERNATMFGPAGHLYVYFIYGMHWCANVVCGPEGSGTAVLLRAAQPLTGLDEMRTLRPKAKRDQDLCSGPAKLCQAFGIDGAFDGTDLIGPGEVSIVDDGVVPPTAPGNSTRIGLSAGAESPWRWFVADNEHVSR